MKAEINNVEVAFEESDTLGVKSWFARVCYQQYELDFDFDERELIDNHSRTTKIDQKLLIDVVKHVLDNMKTIQSQGASVLTELFKQIINDQELILKKGYFNPEGVTLKSVLDTGATAAGRIPEFEYEVYYFLESEIDMVVIDPYHAYYARFSNGNGLTLIGVRRV